MSLKTYRQKRNFKATAEPAGKVKNSHSKNLYLIQKHAASRLHYDFRIELNGTLKSWAVPKGPCLDPSVKRLAVHVEDHPIEYGSFEGTIPKGQYGGGTVMLWDTGSWQADDENPAKAYAKGDLKFTLQGEKLKGQWKLIRIQKDPKNWLLIKVRDKYAKEAPYDITEKKSRSVLSKKSIEQIPKITNKVWNSDKKSTAAPTTRKSKTSAAKKKAKSKTTVKLEEKTEKPKQQKRGDSPTMPTSKQVLSHPEKILYPEGKITKADLADYYTAVQKWILPYLAKRPLTLVRCPQGYTQTCFFQKHIEKNSVDSLYTVAIKDKSKQELYPYLQDNEGLIALVQLGVLEIHSWGSHIDDPEKPDVIIFDLDPAADVAWKEVIKGAKLIREKLAILKLKSFVKTTGGKGLHVVVPIKRKYTWDEVKEFTRAFADSIVAAHPQDYIATMSKAKRKGKIFIDYLRNGHGATAIAPYSTRARKHATVSVPLSWDELSVKVQGETFTVKNLPKRLDKLKKDPWKDFYALAQSLPLKKFKR